MVHGNINDGFQRTLDDYILNALADVGSQYVFLFTLFLSGIVGMMEKSGGMFGFTRVSFFAQLYYCTLFCLPSSSSNTNTNRPSSSFVIVYIYIYIYINRILVYGRRLQNMVN